MAFEELRFQELGVMDDAEDTVVVYQLIAVEVLVVVAGVTGSYGLMMLQ